MGTLLGGATFFLYHVFFYSGHIDATNGFLKLEWRGVSVLLAAANQIADVILEKQNLKKHSSLKAQVNS